MKILLILMILPSKKEKNEKKNKPKGYPNSNDMMGTFTMAEDPKDNAVGEKTGNSS